MMQDVYGLEKGWNTLDVIRLDYIYGYDARCLWFVEGVEYLWLKSTTVTINQAKFRSFPISMFSLVAKTLTHALNGVLKDEKYFGPLHVTSQCDQIQTKISKDKPQRQYLTNKTSLNCQKEPKMPKVTKMSRYNDDHFEQKSIVKILTFL